MTTAAARRSLALFLLVAAAALLASGCGGDDASSKDGGGAGGSSTSKAAGSSGECGATKEGDLQIVRHCGDASGEITVDGATVKLDSGACSNTADSVVVNLGESVISASPDEKTLQGHDYLGVVAGKHAGAAPDAQAVNKDGKFTKGVMVSAIMGGKPHAAITMELTMSDGRTAGRFSGTGTSGEKVSGTFNCG